MRNFARLRWPAILCATLLILGVLLLGVALILRSRPPVYQGHDYYYWAKELQQAQRAANDPNRLKRIETAVTAIRAMGTQTLPFVMAELRADFTVKDRVVDWLGARLIPQARSLRLQPAKMSEGWSRSIRVLEVLGPIASPCLPELTRLTSKNGPYTAGALLAVGADAIPAFTNLLLTSTSPLKEHLIDAFTDSVLAGRIKQTDAALAFPSLVNLLRTHDYSSQTYAVSALRAMHLERATQPRLVNGLNDAAAIGRDSCVRALGLFGDAASPSATNLAAIFDSADASTRSDVCDALARFYSAGHIALPVLMRGLHDSDERVRASSASALGQFPPLATQTVPVLMQAASDRDPMVRLYAVQSLGRLGCRADATLSCLRLCCKDPDVAVREQASNALQLLRVPVP